MTVSKELIIVLFAIFGAGCFTGYKIAKNVKGTQEVIANVQTQQIQSTQVAYVPKVQDAKTGKTEKTDIDLVAGKPVLYVKVNGKETTFEKADNENYVLEKNKVTLTQTSTSTIDIKTNTIDTSRLWAVGVDAMYDFRDNYGMRYGGTLEYNLFNWLSINAGLGQGYTKIGAYIRF
jgi:hypothetical protein